MVAGNTSPLREQVERIFASTAPSQDGESHAMLATFREELNSGSIRTAEIVDGSWRVNTWVKKGILLHARLGKLIDTSPLWDKTCFDLDTLPTRRFSATDNVRVPAGSTIRDGAYLGSGVACMPPSIIQIGAWVGPGTIIDSHVTVGTCAQIGHNVRISCGTNIGGVVEPLEALPTIISDDVVIAGNCGIYDGVFVGEGTLIGAGTILTGRSRVYDFRNRKMFRAHPDQPLIIPPLSVVVPGARPIIKGAAASSGLMIQVAVIVGTRDEIDPDKDYLEDLME